MGVAGLIAGGLVVAGLIAAPRVLGLTSIAGGAIFLWMVWSIRKRMRVTQEPDST